MHPALPVVDVIGVERPVSEVGRLPGERDRVVSRKKHTALGWHVAVRIAERVESETVDAQRLENRLEHLGRCAVQIVGTESVLSAAQASPRTSPSCDANAPFE